MSNIDWQAIRSDYESGGMSLRQLAATYGISKTYLIEKRNKEGWNRPQADRPTSDRPGPIPISHLPVPSDAVSIARIGLSQLAKHLQSNEILEIKDHKSLSDALAQYVKVLQTAPKEDPQEQPEGMVIPMGKLSEEARAKIRLVLAEDQKSGESAG